MNYAIVKPNAKGQLVIPQAMRKALAITPDTHLHISLQDKVITIQPFSEVVVSQRAKNLSYLKILKKTQGAWAGDNWPISEKKQHTIEIAAAKKLKKQSW